jgi:hypothetical protein
MVQSLAQVAASENAARAEANKRLGAIHKNSQKTELYNGVRRTYAPFDDDPDGRNAKPPESKRVQLVAADLITGFFRELAPAVDLAAAKDTANCKAFADVVLADGTLLLKAVPATHLLHMEHVMDDISTFLARIPVHSDDDDWSPDAERPGVFRNAGTQTVSSDKQMKVLTLAAATKEHQAVGQPYNEDIPVGTWTTVKLTGALRPERKRELERRASELKDAFKRARDVANRVEAPPVREADRLFQWLLAE